MAPLPVKRPKLITGQFTHPPCRSSWHEHRATRFYVLHPHFQLISSTHWRFSLGWGLFDSHLLLFSGYPKSLKARTVTPLAFFLPASTLASRGPWNRFQKKGCFSLLAMVVSEDGQREESIHLVCKTPSRLFVGTTSNHSWHQHRTRSRESRNIRRMQAEPHVLGSLTKFLHQVK